MVLSFFPILSTLASTDCTAIEGHIIYKGALTLHWIKSMDHNKGNVKYHNVTVK